MKSKAYSLLEMILTTLLLLVLADFSYAQPKAFMPKTTWDFGKAPQGSVLSHSYWLKNMGTDTLRITKVSPG